MGYPSDLKEKEWLLIEHHFRPQDRRGSACKHSRKRIVDAILYVLKSGTQWRMLPSDFPPWKTVYDHFSRWNKRGVWEAALNQVNARHRKKTNVTPNPATASSTLRARKPSTAAKNAALTAGKK